MRYIIPILLSLSFVASAQGPQKTNPAAQNVWIIDVAVNACPNGSAGTVTLHVPRTGYKPKSARDFTCTAQKSCSFMFPKNATNTLVTVKASPTGFQSFEGACKGSDPNGCSVDVKGPRAVTANYCIQ